MVFCCASLDELWHLPETIKQGKQTSWVLLSLQLLLQKLQVYGDFKAILQCSWFYWPVYLQVKEKTQKKLTTNTTALGSVCLQILVPRVTVHFPMGHSKNPIKLSLGWCPVTSVSLCQVTSSTERSYHPNRRAWPHDHDKEAEPMLHNEVRGERTWHPGGTLKHFLVLSCPILIGKWTNAADTGWERLW